MPVCADRLDGGSAACDPRADAVPTTYRTHRVVNTGVLGKTKWEFVRRREDVSVYCERTITKPISMFSLDNRAAWRFV